MNQVLDQITAKATEAGGVVTIPTAGGWMLDISQRADGQLDLKHRNPAPDGGEKFFAFSTVGRQYGDGRTIQEPSLGVELSGVGEKNETLRIVAPIVIENGKVTLRLSWSRLVYVEKKTFSLHKDGSLTIDGQFVGHLVGVFLPDKNRLDGYVGIFDAKKQIPLSQIKVLEMESIIPLLFG